MKQIEATGRLDIVMRSNGGLSVEVQIVDAQGQAFDDMTGSTIRADLRTVAGAAEAEASLASGDGIVDDDLENAMFTLQWPEGLAPGTYEYDVLRVEDGYEPQPLFSGKMTVQQGVTVIA